MSLQAYFDNIKAKTGKTAEDFKAMAAEKNLNTIAEILAWCKSEFSLGHGHAMAIAHHIVHKDHLESGTDEKVANLFKGNKAHWRISYDDLMNKITAFGPDISTSAGLTYVNLLRGKKKFAIVQPSSAERLDIGIKLKGAKPVERFEAAGSWNDMVTHRIRITASEQIDVELIDWLKSAYDAA